MGDKRVIGRRVWAVLAGVLTVVIGSTVTDAVMHATGIFPPLGQPMADGLFGLALAYRCGWGVLGSYVTARVAPFRPMWHVMAGATLGLVAATAGAVATWNMGPEFGPHWYPLSLIATTVPCSWIGGKLYTGSGRNRTAAAGRA